MKDKILSLSFILLICYMGYCGYKGTELADALVIGFLSALAAFQSYISSKKAPDISKEVKERLVVLEDKLSSISLSSIKGGGNEKRPGQKPYGW